MTVGPVGGVIIIAVVVALFGVLWLVLRRMQQHHDADAAAVSSWATDHGYTYVESDDESWANRWHFAPFGIGTFQHANHVVTGTYGDASFGAFDYRYDTPGGQNQHNTHHFAVIAVTLPHDVPWFDARKRKHHVVPHHDATELAIGDKNFDSHFIVHTQNPDYARSALTPQLRAMLVEHDLQGIHVVDGRLFGWKDQTHHKVATLPGRLSALAAAASALPPA